MIVAYDLIREIGVERDRWMAEGYLCMVYTTVDKWEDVVDYVGKWADCTYNIQDRSLHIEDGGIIKLVDISQQKDSDTMKIDCAGYSITTTILDMSNVLLIDWRDFPLYAMSRTRNTKEVNGRVVII